MGDFWFVAVPLVIVWALALVDIYRHSGSGWSKALWIIACTFVWPVIIAWYLLRPTPGRLATASEQTDDRRAAAVSAMLEWSRGGLTGSALQERLRRISANDSSS